MAALQQVAIPARPRVGETGVAAMRLAHGTAEARDAQRDNNQANVVGHQAIGPDLDAVPACLFGEHVAVDIMTDQLQLRLPGTDKV
jgi:hypothetical protein